MVSTKRVSEPNSLSYEVKHVRRWVSCLFLIVPEFVAKTQNLYVLDLHFGEFTIPSPGDFVDGDKEEMPFCPVRAVRHYLGRNNLFICTG